MRNKKITAADIKRDWKRSSKLLRLWWNFQEWFCNLVPDKIKYKYWEILPYDFRPFQLLYRFKCWAWYRYTTVKPRYLTHCWHDRVATLPHTIFEILSDFVEKECVGGCVDWFHEDCHKIKVNGLEIPVIDEMLALYNWWHLKYNKAYKEIEEGWWKKLEALEVEDDWPEEEFKGQKVYRWEKRFKNLGDEQLYYFYLDQLNRMERLIDEELDEKLHRVINVRYSLWT